jgi:hypothetical protein
MRQEHDNKLYLPAHGHVICTMQKALMFFDDRPGLLRPPDFKLGTLLEHFQIPYSSNQLHDASYDVERTADLLVVMQTWDHAETDEQRAVA